MEEFSTEQKELLQDIIDAPNLGLAVYKAIRNESDEIIDFVHEYINKKTLLTLGQDMTGKLLSDHGTDGSDQLPRFIEAIEKEKTVTYIKRVTLNDAAHWISFSNAPIGEDRLVHIWEDISELKRMEAELIETKLKQQKEILNAIVLAQEQERHRIGMELHDGVAQLLYAIQLRLQLVDAGHQTEKEKINEVLKIVNGAIDDTRRVSFELVPSVLKDFGLETALTSLFQRLVPEAFKLNYKFAGIKDRLSDKLEFTLFRVIQELVLNIVKHAKATTIDICITIKKEFVHITVKDDGVGFSEKELDPLTIGIGLQSVRNRIMLLDGKIKIDSGSKGTFVAIEVPV